MLDFKHESNKFSTQRGDPREATHSGKANPGGMDWNKDRRTVAGFGGPAAGMDKRFVWIKPHDSGALDSWSEPGGSPSLKSEGPSRSHDSADACCKAKVGAAPGKEPAGIRLAQGYLGWADAGDTLKREFWSEAESAASPEVVASIRLQPKAGQLCLSSGPRRRFP